MKKRCLLEAPLFVILKAKGGTRMQHEEYIRIVPGAKTAVLFIHGIVGTPNHFRDLIPLIDLVPETNSIYNVLLDGHGKTVDDFTKTSMKIWRKQVWSIFEELTKTHEQVILVAHSMGTLFSIRLAIEHPDKVPFLFLIAVPLRPGIRLMTIRNLLCLVFDRLREDIPLEAATLKVCGLQTTRKLWKYIPWIPRFLELFAEIYRTEKIMGDLSVPCTAYQSQRDELVTNCTRKVLEKSGVMRVHNLRQSTHFYYHPDDQIIVRSDFERQIKETHG